MSNFEVSYFQLNEARSRTRQAASGVSSCASRLRRQSTALMLQYGFGIPDLRQQILRQSQLLSQYANNVTAMSNFLGEVEKTTKQYEKSALNVLQKSKPKEDKSFWKDLGELISGPFVDFITDLVGAVEGWEAWSAIADFLEPLGEILKGEYIESIISGVGNFAKRLIDFNEWGEAAGAVAGWATEWAKNIYSNFFKEENSTGRAVAESVMEGIVGAIPALLGFGITAAVTGTIGAPAVVAAAIAFGAKKLLDGVANWITGTEDGFIEVVSDAILDGAQKMWDGMVGMAQNAWDGIKKGASAVADWFSNPFGWAFG